MTPPLTYSMEQASQRLGKPFTVDWLKGHLHDLPHVKLGGGHGRGGRVGFSEAHLLRIVEMFTVDPAPIPVPQGPIRRRRAS